MCDKARGVEAAVSCYSHNGPVLPGFDVGLPESQTHQDPTSVYQQGEMIHQYLGQLRRFESV